MLFVLERGLPASDGGVPDTVAMALVIIISSGKC